MPWRPMRVHHHFGWWLIVVAGGSRHDLHSVLPFILLAALDPEFDVGVLRGKEHKVGGRGPRALILLFLEHAGAERVIVAFHNEFLCFWVFVIGLLSVHEDRKLCCINSLIVVVDTRLGHGDLGPFADSLGHAQDAVCALMCSSVDLDDHRRFLGVVFGIDLGIDCRIPYLQLDS